MHDGFYGWINDPQAVEKVLGELPQPLFASAAPHLKGSGAKEDTLLYLGVRKVLGGKDAPKGPQKIGDCVSWGWGNLINYAQCTAVLKGEPVEYQEIATESIYALSRVEVGGQRGSYQDGSVGAWAAKACTNYGVLSRNEIGAYDPKRAKEWGAKGLPDELEPKAKLHVLKTTSLIQNFEEACDAIQNGYPVAVCSMQGFSMQRDNEGFCRPEGTWAHCMAFVAKRFGNRPGLCCSQSWGPNTPSGPLALEQPDNTFWVDAETCNRMFRQRDSFTGSPFVGYPAAKIPDWYF